LVSPDGITWSELAATLGTQVWNGVLWDAGAGLFVAYGPSFVYTSPDGVTWTLVTNPSGELQVLASNSAGLWVGATVTGAFGGVAFSTDRGSTWTNVHVGSHLAGGMVGYKTAIFADKRFVLGRESGSTIEFALSQRAA
ncbi:MAG TPA: hypothetical protein VK745_12140, partial [Polyangiaceae bacterium]|nr:hypothetical protein [Polyangiaceae bacterium]